MPPNPSRVFISYHRADLDTAERVRAHLAVRGIGTWMDRYDIPVGAYWPDEIDRGLADSTIVLGLLSPHAVDARNVKNEWDWALQNGKQLVLLKTRECVVPHRYVSVNFIEAEGERLTVALDAVSRLAGVTDTPEQIADPVTRYALAGDVSIAYQQFGTGPVDFVWVPGYISHCDHTWRLPYIAEHFRRLGTLFRVIMFDKRGTGLSDRTSIAEPLEHRMDDIRAVMDACGVERAVIAGLSQGVPLSCLFAATYPERTHALVLYGGYAAEFRHDDYPWSPTLEERQRQIEDNQRTLHQKWGSEEQAREFGREMFPSKADDPETIQWVREFVKLAASPGADIALARTDLLIDVRAVLPSIRVPTLVFHKTGDRSCKLEEGRYVADRIPGAAFIEIPGDDHVPWLGDEETYFEELARLAKRIQQGDNSESEPDSLLATVAVAGVPGDGSAAGRASTEQMALRHRGRLVNRDDPDWLVVTFDGPAKALRFAEELARADGVPAGITVGEVTLRGETVSGDTVGTARQLAEHARRGQVLVTGIVRDLAPGSGFTFRPIDAEPGLPALFEARSEPATTR